ncbi:MAG: PIG-L family deacetylase [Cellulomonas sp.]
MTKPRRPARRPGTRLARTLGACGVLGALWFTRGVLISVALVTLPLGATPVAVKVAPETPCTVGAMQIVAHQDDDLLFQSPDLAEDVLAGRCVRTVFLTAGDAAQGETYWRGREAGSLAAYAQMAGVADRWSSSDAGLPGHAVRLMTLTDAPQVSVVFMRLPDGNRTGTGMLVHHYQSLRRLWDGDITTIDAVDGSATYSSASLTSSLTDLMTRFHPTTVRTQDWTIEFRHGDNADHTATALFARQADAGYRSPHTLLAYGGYPMWTRLPNVAGPDLKAKKNAFLAYAAHDSKMCLEPWCGGDIVSTLRLARQYVVATEDTGDVTPARD